MDKFYPQGPNPVLRSYPGVPGNSKTLVVWEVCKPSLMTQSGLFLKLSFLSSNLRLELSSVELAELKIVHYLKIDV